MDYRDYSQAQRRLRALFQRKLDHLRAQGIYSRAEVQRSEIVAELAGVVDEEAAVRLAVRELRTNWHVDPVDGWVLTRSETRFAGAFFTDFH
jgi:hypothetical protein